MQQRRIKPVPGAIGCSQKWNFEILVIEVVKKTSEPEGEVNYFRLFM
jgi:hypothetical protein